MSKANTSKEAVLLLGMSELREWVRQHLPTSKNIRAFCDLGDDLLVLYVPPLRDEDTQICEMTFLLVDTSLPAVAVYIRKVDPATNLLHVIEQTASCYRDDDLANTGAVCQRVLEFVANGMSGAAVPGLCEVFGDLFRTLRASEPDEREQTARGHVDKAIAAWMPVPDRRLSYIFGSTYSLVVRRLRHTHVLNGPVGLFYVNTKNPAVILVARFCDSVDRPKLNSFLGVSLRRFVDPEWTTTRQLCASVHTLLTDPDTHIPEERLSECSTFLQTLHASGRCHGSKTTSEQ